MVNSSAYTIVVKPESNEYHLIHTQVFTSFKPPSTQTEAPVPYTYIFLFETLQRANKASRICVTEIFRIEATSAIEYKYFPIEQISVQIYIPRWQPNKKSQETVEGLEQMQNELAEIAALSRRIRTITDYQNEVLEEYIVGEDGGGGGGVGVEERQGRPFYSMAL